MSPMAPRSTVPTTPDQGQGRRRGGGGPDPGGVPPGGELVEGGGAARGTATNCPTDGSAHRAAGGCRPAPPRPRPPRRSAGSGPTADPGRTAPAPVPARRWSRPDRRGTAARPRRPRRPRRARGPHAPPAPAASTASSSSAWAPWKPGLEDPAPVGGEPGAPRHLEQPDLLVAAGGGGPPAPCADGGSSPAGEVPPPGAAPRPGPAPGCRPAPPPVPRPPTAGGSGAAPAGRWNGP